MIDKNFYLENLTAFDMLIEADRPEAEKVIFKVYCILQRDRIWLNEVATPEELSEEEAELLDGVETELNELDEQYGFRFAHFHNLVLEEMQKSQLRAGAAGEEDFYDEEEEEFDEDDGFLDSDAGADADPSNPMDAFTDEELNLVADYILNSAKKRFNYPQFLQSFPDAGEEFIDDHILLPIIAGKAYGEPDGVIARKLADSLQLHGFEVVMQELIQLTERKGKELGLEILAFGIAMDSLQQGTLPVDVVAHISRWV